MIEVERFREGDHRYFAEIMRGYGPLVLKICTSFGSSEEHVQDLFQEIWTRVYERRRSYRAEGSFEAWLSRVARNQCVTDYRARRTRRETMEKSRETGAAVELSWQPTDAERKVGQADLRERLLAAIQELPEREMESIRLRFLGDLSTAEVADLMGIDPTTVRSNTCRGLRRLRGLIKEWNE